MKTITNMLQLFETGDVIYGFCNGYFGGDDYDTKTCIMVAPKYVLFENEEGFGTVLDFDDRLTRELIDTWKYES